MEGFLSKGYRVGAQMCVCVFDTLPGRQLDGRGVNHLYETPRCGEIVMW